MKRIPKSLKQMCGRELIFRLHEDGKSYNKIDGIVNRNKSTIHYIIKKWKNDGTLANKTRSDRPKKLSGREEKVIIRELKKKNPTTSAPQLTSMVADMFHKEVHPGLCRRILRNNDFHGRVPRNRPYINAVNHRKRLTFAKTYIYKDNSFWDKIIFSDESKFNIFGSNGQNYVWRKSNTELEIRYLHETVKHGGGSIMV